VLPWRPVDLSEFQFVDRIGQKIRLVPATMPSSAAPIPLALRGIKVSQLQQFYENFPGFNSREMQEMILVSAVCFWLLSVFTLNASCFRHAALKT
jgi:hypothetical protein